MSNVKFTQLPDQGALTDATIVPTVASGVNYTVTGANLKTYVNSTTGNVTAGNLLTGGVVSAAGNITGAYILGNGSLLTGLPATYGNANVSNYLASGTNGANIVTQANVAGAYVIADGSALTNLTGAAISGTISVAGNITGAYLKGNISAATGGYGNSNVQLVLQTYSGTLTAATVSATGNITGAYFSGNGSQLTGITASLGGTMVSNIAGAGYSITGLGTLSATGNITAANINGNLTGSGAALTGIPTSIVAGTGISVSGPTGAVTITNNNPTPYTNTNVAAFLPTYTGNLTAGNASISGTVTGTHLGNGGGLTNVVTSIVAGSGISINASTGAVTVTATGGGSGNSSVISSGFAFANANATTGGGGNILYLYNGSVAANANWAGNTIVIQNQQGSNSTGMLFTPGGNINMSAATGGFINLAQSVNVNGTFYVGFGSASNTQIAGGNITASGPISTGVYTISSKPSSGTVGQFICISNSPTYAGQLAYWCTTATAAWRYVGTNTAV